MPPRVPRLANFRGPIDGQLVEIQSSIGGADTTAAMASPRPTSYAPVYPFRLGIGQRECGARPGHFRHGAVGGHSADRGSKGSVGGDAMQFETVESSA